VPLGAIKISGPGGFKETLMPKNIDKLTTGDFLVGCLIVVAALFAIPLMVLFFKVSLYLAIITGVVLAVILGIALLGRVFRIILARIRHPAGAADDTSGPVDVGATQRTIKGPPPGADDL
jgi:hypothetical protein